MSTTGVAKYLNCSQSHVSHGLKMLEELELVRHPSPYRKSWIVNSDNSLISILESLFIASKDDRDLIRLLSIPSVIKVGTLISKEGQLTIPALLNKTKLSRNTLIKILECFVEKGIINKINGNPNRYYPINQTKTKLFFEACKKIQLVTAQKDRKNSFRRLNIEQLLKKIQREESVLILIQYGSAIRGKEDRLSDVDLFAVVRDKIARGDLIHKYRDDRLDLNVLSKKGFIEIIRKEPHFVHQLRDCVFLKGKSLFMAAIE